MSFLRRGEREVGLWKKRINLVKREGMEGRLA